MDKLCPLNAPKRCEWCGGPYHIRKRCPKLASLANENERRKQAQFYEQQQQHMHNYNSFHPYPFRGNAPMVDPRGYPLVNAYDNGMFDPAHQRPMRRPYQYGNTRGFYHPHHPSMEQQAMNAHPANNSPRACFLCGSPEHIKAHCPQNRPSGIQRQRSAK